jgi:hypothetical protein
MAAHAESHQVSGHDDRFVGIRMARLALDLLVKMLGMAEFGLGGEHFGDGFDRLIGLRMAVTAFFRFGKVRLIMAHAARVVTRHAGFAILHRVTILAGEVLGRVLLMVELESTVRAHCLIRDASGHHQAQRHYRQRVPLFPQQHHPALLRFWILDFGLVFETRVFGEERWLRMGCHQLSAPTTVSQRSPAFAPIQNPKSLSLLLLYALEMD